MNGTNTDRGLVSPENDKVVDDKDSNFSQEREAKNSLKSSQNSDQSSLKSEQSSRKLEQSSRKSGQSSPKVHEQSSRKLEQSSLKPGQRSQQFHEQRSHSSEIEVASNNSDEIHPQKTVNGVTSNRDEELLNSDFRNDKFEKIDEHEYNDYVRRRKRRKHHTIERKVVTPDFTELEPLNQEARKNHLDFENLQEAFKSIQLQTFDDSSDDDSKLSRLVAKKKKDDFQPSPKLNTFVGFLRLANYVNAVCVLFGVVLSILLEDQALL